MCYSRSMKTICWAAVAADERMTTLQLATWKYFAHRKKFNSIMCTWISFSFVWFFVAHFSLNGLRVKISQFFSAYTQHCNAFFSHIRLNCVCETRDASHERELWKRKCNCTHSQNERLCVRLKYNGPRANETIKSTYNNCSCSARHCSHCTHFLIRVAFMRFRFICLVGRLLLQFCFVLFCFEFRFINAAATITLSDIMQCIQTSTHTHKHLIYSYIYARHSVIKLKKIFQVK